MTEEALGEDPAPRAGTGLPDVDGVLAEVATLAERPVEEHVAVYESAHEVLRGALDGAPLQP